MALGQILVPAQQINPFSGVAGASPGIAPTAVPAIAAMPPNPAAGAQPNEGLFKQYVGGWKNFIQRMKTDPNLRMAMYQTILGMTQPAATPEAGIGRALAAGVNTYKALQDAQQKDAQQAFQNQIAQREMANREQQTQNQEAQLTNQQSQFAQTLAQRHAELQARLTELQNNKAYQDAQIAVAKAKLAQGGEQGQVNARWTRLAHLVQKTQPQLFGTDPQKAWPLAQAYAWDLMHSGQTRATLKAKMMNDNELYAPRQGPHETQGQYNKRYLDWVKQESRNMDVILNEAGVTDKQAFPGAESGGTPAPTPTAGATPGTPPPAPLATGQHISIRGASYTISGVTDQTVTVVGADGKPAILKRSALENLLNGG